MVKCRGEKTSQTCHKQRHVNFIQNDANSVNSFSHFLIGYLKKSIKSHG